MAFIRNLWYMVAWSRDVGETTFERTIAGRLLHIVRRSHGELRVTHAGWRLACTERHTAVWVWFGAPAAADPSQITDLAFLEERADGRHTLGVPVPVEALNDLLLSPAHLARLCPQQDAAAIDGVVLSEPHGLRIDWAVAGAVLRGIADGDDAVRPWDLAMQALWSPPATLRISGSVVGAAEPPQTWVDVWIVSPVDEASSICFHALCDAPGKSSGGRSAFEPGEIDALVDRGGRTAPMNATKVQARSAASRARALLCGLLAQEARMP